MSWTPAQRQAIEAEPCTLLVSAAAGSGKTAVLTQRIVTKITDPQDPLTVENVAVVTFTKAAAQELKQRLHDNLSAAVSREPANRRLMSQLMALPNARISTIHSFCLRLIRENTAQLGLSPQVKVADEPQAKALLREAMTQVLRGYYDPREGATHPHRPEDFTGLLEICGVKSNDEPLLNWLEALYNALRNYPDYRKHFHKILEESQKEWELCRQQPARLYQAPHVMALARQVRRNLRSAVKKMELARDLAAADWDLENQTRLLDRELRNARLALESSPAILRYNLAGCTFPTLRFPTKYADLDRKEQITELRKAAKKEIADAQKLLDGRTTQQMLELERANLDLAQVSLALMSDLDRCYRRLKDEQGLLDYADLEHLTVALLCQQDPDGTVSQTPLARQVADGICELYVDEYQDTNALQDRIFCAATHPGRRFMVGDPKQSIYGFRGARPEIFTGYKNRFPLYDQAQGATERKILLSHNFRCDPNVIELTNRVFSVLMNTDPAAPLYLEEDRLRHAKLHPLALPDLPCELLLTDRRNAGEDEEDDDPEAARLAQRLRRLMQEGLLTETGRRLQWEDVAVLARDHGLLKTIKKAFAAQGIPCAEDADESFFAAPEILFFTALLQLVENPHDDVATAAVMNSPVFAFTPDQMLAIRRHHPQSSFYAALGAYDAADAIGQKCRRLQEVLAQLRSFARGHGACDLLLQAIELTDGENLYAASDPTLPVHSNLRILLDLAADSDAAGDGDLLEFLQRLEQMRQKNKKGEGGGANAVSLFTIHHAKGLEYPCVILAGMGKSFTKAEGSPISLLDPQLGLCFKVADPTGLCRLRTDRYNAARLRRLQDNLEEEKRLLYVAMTRARQKLILSGCTDLSTLLARIYPSLTFRADTGPLLLENKACNYLELVCASLGDMPQLYQALSDAKEQRFGTYQPAPYLEIATASRTQALNAPALPLPDLRAAAAPCPEFEPRALQELLDFQYPFATLSQIPKKVSVSSLRPVTDLEQEPPQPRDLSEIFSTQPSPTGSFAGTAAHQFMQFCQYPLARRDCRAEAQRLVDRGFLTPEQQAVLDVERLESFFESDLYRRIQASPRLHRELRFNVFLPAHQLLPDAPEHSVLLQGVIDCFFQEADGSFTLVDFKTDRVQDPQVLIQRHSRQLQIYRLAVEKMTGCPVGRLVLWSFALKKEVPVPLA